jgi:hypothetical protein
LASHLFYLDSDAYYTDDGGSLKIQEVDPNDSFVNGGSHNTLIVATSDGLIAVEAPGDDGQSKIVICCARSRYRSTKCVKHLKRSREIAVPRSRRIRALSRSPA